MPPHLKNARNHPCPARGGGSSHDPALVLPIFRIGARLHWERERHRGEHNDRDADRREEQGRRALPFLDFRQQRNKVALSILGN